MTQGEELLAITAQRDRLAQYIFEEDGGDLDNRYCREEMAAGRCPYRNLPYGEDREVSVCAPCIATLIGVADTAPNDPLT